jgi:hypothetical protein
MNSFHAEVSAVIDARPEEIYALLADYRVGHPSILPEPYFTGLEVLEGGHGAGTVIRVKMSVMGAKREYREEVSEPQPGRVLVEADADAGVRTTFTVEPLEGGRRAKLTIATDSRTSSGLTGWFERLFNPAITRRIYRKELEKLAIVLRNRPETSST